MTAEMVFWIGYNKLDKKTFSHGKIKKQSRKKCQDNNFDSELINLVSKLHAQVAESKGKKVYGYLKHDVYSSAKVEFPSLVDNKEFRSVKNMIVQTVLQMDFQQPEIKVEIPEIADENTEQIENEMLANTILSLFVNLSRCIEDDYQHKFQSGRKMIDSKLRRMIQEKNQDLGIKQEHGQTQEC